MDKTDELDLEEKAMLAQTVSAQINFFRGRLEWIDGRTALTAFDLQHGQGDLPPPHDPPAAVNGKVICAELEKYVLPVKTSLLQKVHEKLLDASFCWKDDGLPSSDLPLYKTIRDIMSQAYWGSLVSDLTLAVPSYARIASKLRDIRELLASYDFKKENTDDIALLLNPRRLLLPLTAETIDWSNFVKLLAETVGVVLRMQAPGRHAKLNGEWDALSSSLEKAKSTERARLCCESLKFMMDCVNLMTADVQNAHLAKISAVLDKKGWKYEKEVLNRALKTEPMAFDITRGWLRTAMRVAAGADNPRLRLEKLCEADPDHHVVFLRCAMLSLVTQRQAVTLSTCPETLELDKRRITWMRSKFEGHVLAATSLMKVSFLSRGDSIPPGWLDLWREQTESGIRESVQAGVPLGDAVPSAVKRAVKHKDDSKACLTGAQQECMLRTLDSPNTGLSDLMRNRVAKAWSLLFMTPASKKVEDGYIIREAKLPDCMGAVISEMRECVQLLNRLVCNNILLFWNPHYKDMILEESQSDLKKRKAQDPPAPLGGTGAPKGQSEAVATKEGQDSAVGGVHKAARR